MRKKIYILLVATFLEDRRIISYYKYFCGKNGGEGEFFLKTLGRQIDVKREIHIHLYLANYSVLV